MRINIKPLNNNKTELYQWDTDRQIEITPDDGIVVDEIHYATVMLREALVVLPHVVDGTYIADIPNILLQSANTIHIYVVTHTANGERTIDDTTLGIIRRKKPSDYVYTETEVMRYDNLESRIKELEDNQVSDETLNEMVQDYLAKNPIKIDVDKELSEVSENPVENKSVAKAIREVNEKIPTDYVTDEELDKKGYLTEHQDLSGYAKREEIPTELPASDVYGWAKQPTKPSYNASEVGALPNTTRIPSKTSELQNDSGYLTQHQDISHLAPKATTLAGYGITDGAEKTDIPIKPEQVGAEPVGTADTKVSVHNTSDTAHNDIRILIKNLTTKVTALLDSDDETLDQTSEIVAYIKSNKSLIDAITTSKVSVDDIVDNLTTNLSNKPLSAAQGVKLKGLYDSLKGIVDNIDTPTQLSQLTEDATHRTVTDAEKKLWNDKIGAAELNQSVTASLKEAKESGDFKGDPGEMGPQGPAGAKGDKGEKGATGKTAYEYAKDGGYTGTETEFKEKMAADTVSVTYDAATKTLNISSGGGNS